LHVDEALGGHLSREPAREEFVDFEAIVCDDLGVGAFIVGYFVGFVDAAEEAFSFLIPLDKEEDTVKAPM
jgi:hypothetical protein